MLSVAKLLLKGKVGGCALNNHGNYIVDHWKIHGIVFLNFCGNPAKGASVVNVVLQHNDNFLSVSR